MVVSFDVDACVDSSAPALPSQSSVSRVDVDSLTDLFSKPSLNIKFPSSSVNDSVLAQSRPLKIISEGKMRPHDTLLKLKTRSMHNPPDDLDGYIQLYLAGAKHLYIGRHNRGNFAEVEKYDFSTIPSSLNAGAVKLAIATLNAALVMVVEEVRKAGEKSPKMTLLFQDGDLRLMERLEGSPAPFSSKLLRVIEKNRS